MPAFTEKSVVEDYIIEKLTKKGWRFVSADELERESLEEPLLTNTLLRALKKLNSDIGITDQEIKQVLNELKLKGAGIEGSKRILTFFKFGIPVKFEKERVVKYVKLFDFVDVANNEFIVSRQASYQSGDKQIRTDIMLYVNGIPLVDIECKNPASFSENWYHAYRQIKDYEKTVPELYKYVQIGVATEQVAKYFTIVPWQEEVKIHEWKEELKDPTDATLEMLSKNTLLDIIQNYLFFRIELGNATKVIARYMQYRASQKIVDRVIKNLEGVEDKNRGLIWHWQGSGKTLTMIFAANKLYYSPKLENPSIFFIVDRIELEEQLYQEFYSLDIVEPEIIGSVEELRAALRHDDGRGKRGIMIVLIHKFRPEELSELQGELDELSRNKETILKRRNVIAFVDEGHRTQYGTLAAQMRNIFRGAFFFAFTGTPISKRGRDTYLAFSYPDEEKYLDKYFITDSIRDGFTKKIVYQPRLEKEVHLKKELLEAFLEVEFEELPEEVRGEVEEKVRQRLNTMKVILENPERIAKVADDIAQHFKENVDGKFKAMVVAVNRVACAHYKRELDKHLPKEYSVVVMTYQRDDPEPIQWYVKEAKARYGEREMDEIRKDVVQRFKEDELPKILIVTDMLLTGFDAPILLVIYLDKPLKEHRLLQAMARTNRPFKDLKEAGIIIDYVGILKEFKRAFEIYSKEEIRGALSEIEAMRDDFVAIMDGTLEIFQDVPRDSYDRETLLRAVEVVTSDEENSKTFLENYKTLRKLFELLGPDVIKAERFSDYKWLSSVYVYYMKKVLRGQPSYEGYAQRYFDKTVKYVHKSTELERLEKELPVIAFDENYIKSLEEKIKSWEEKAADIVFTLNRFVLVERHKNPVYESLVERVENIVKLWKEKTKDFERIYREGVGVIEEIKVLTDRQKKLGFNDLEYSLLLVLEKEFGKDDGLVEDTKDLSRMIGGHTFPGWASQPTAKKEVERGVRRFVRRYVKKYGVGLDQLDGLHKRLLESVRTYGQTI